MKTSPAGISLITEFEGVRHRAYQDIKGIWTIGYGHTGKEVHKGLVWSQEQCEKQLAADLEQREKQLTLWLESFPTTQHQFDALISLGYNIGMGALKGSEVLENHRRQRYNQAADAFMNWTHASGQQINGLVRRRVAEKALYERR